VPPGFNALLEKRSALVAELVGKHVLPVFRVDDQESPTFEGSCVAIKARDAHFIVSAAHALDATSKGGVHLLLNGRERNPLENPTWATVTSRPESRSDDLVDLGYVRLNDFEIDAIGPTNFLEVVEGAPLPKPHWASRHIAFGFPANRQSRDDVEMQYNLTQSYYTSPEIQIGKYAGAKLSHGDHFAVQFDQRQIASARGRGGRPNFIGMSGGGIWVIDPYTDYSLRNYPQFVGFLLGTAPRNGKVLFGSRANMFFEILSLEASLPAI
jgi:hypothetical protein